MQITKVHHIYNRIRRQALSHVVITRIFIGFILALTLIGGWFVFQKPAQQVLTGLGLVAGKPLPSSSGRVNFVLLGSGGEGHDGPDLTDTIIFISTKVETGETTLISIPRDMWIPSLRAKINSAYYYGFAKQATSGGMLLAKSAISESINQPVHFAVKLDFSTFSKFIDAMGGIDITVDQAFDDYKYPIPGKENEICSPADEEFLCRYEHIRFESGPQHMDGDTALKFVRSRHSENLDEGTDFSRSRRQTKVISAIKAKLTSIENLKNTGLYKQLYDIVLTGVVTDITPEYYSTLFQLGLKVRKHPLATYTLSSPDQLENPPSSSKYDYQWVLIPKKNDSSALFEYVTGLLNR